MTKYIASCSFGKDSLATILLAYENNEPLDLIIWSEVMFDDDISGELQEHLDFIYDKAIPKLKNMGYDVKILKSKHTYISSFNSIITRSKDINKNGKLRGWLIPNKCFLNCMGKVYPIKSFLNKLKKQTKEDIITYVGIAIDEQKRLQRVHKNPNKISLLEKYNYTEQMAYDLCEKYDLLSPIYKDSTRGGCWFCPNKNPNEQIKIRNKHPELWDKLYQLSLTPNLAETKFNRTMTFEELNKYLDEKELNNEG